MASGVQNAWSTTAATNGTADDNVNWAEGQSPASVNNSARAVMAALKKYIKDISGGLVTGGTSTAYTLTTNETIALADGVTVTARMSATNGAAPTLNVDSTGAVAIQGIQGTAIPTGTLLAGAVHHFTYYASVAAWIVRGLGAVELGTAVARSFPAGTIMLFQQTAAPTGWTKSTTHNDKALRIVSGAAGSGGSVGFSTVFARSATDGHALTAAENGPHDHDVRVFTGGDGNTLLTTTNFMARRDGAGNNHARDSGDSNNTEMIIASGSGTPHTHDIEMRLQYLDVIAAVKD